MRLKQIVSTNAALNPDGSINWEALTETGVTAYDSATLSQNLAPVLLGLAVLWLVAG